MNAIVNWMEGVLFWLKMGVALVMWIWVLVILPMLIFRRTRARGAAILLHSSLYTAFSCWWFCFIVSYRLFGGIGLLIGLLVAGIGVIPLAFFGLMIKGLWTAGLGPSVLDVFVSILLFIIPRTLGTWILKRSEQPAVAIG